MVLAVVHSSPCAPYSRKISLWECGDASCFCPGGREPLTEECLSEKSASDERPGDPLVLDLRRDNLASTSRRHSFPSSFTAHSGERSMESVLCDVGGGLHRNTPTLDRRRCKETY